MNDEQHTDEAIMHDEIDPKTATSELSHHVEDAVALFQSGYNCAQAIAGAFSDVMDLTREDALRLSAGFGGGMGDHKGTCGTVSAMVMVVSAVEGQRDTRDLADKRALYAHVNGVKASFSDRFQTLICAELLRRAAVVPPPEASERNREYYAKRPCAKFVATAAMILDEWLAERANA